MEPAPLPGEARAASWRVFALVLLSASYFFQSTGHNEAARFDQIRSVTEHGEWWIDRYSANTWDTVSVGGHVFPNKAPGTTLLGLAPWRLARFGLSALPLDLGKQLVLATWFLTILMAALPTALVAVMMLRFLARNGWTTTEATLIGAGYGVGSMAFPWATTFFGHQLAAFFAFGAFYIVWSCRGLGREAPALSLVLAGWMIGFLPVIEYPAAIASGLIVVYAFILLGGRAAFLLLAGAFVGALPLPLYNAAFFGNPLALSYSFHKADSFFAAHQQGFAGVSWPRLSVLNEILFKSQRGLFHANPWLTLCLAAPFLRDRLAGVRREFALAAAIFAAAILFNSGFGDSIVYWGGAFSFGPRHILFALPFAALLAAAALKSAFLGPLTAALIGGTSLLMLIVASVDPRLPYDPTSPFPDFYLPLFSRGLFSINPMGPFEDSAIFGSSGAWNLGRALGLPRFLEIVPLGFVWAIAAFCLFRVRSVAGRAAQGTMVALVLAVVLWPAISGRSSRSALEPGLCQAASLDRTWPHLFDHAVQGEPAANPVRRRVTSPFIAYPGAYPGPYPGRTEAEAPGAVSSLAVTYSGRALIQRSGWHVVRLESIGRAVVYVDGVRRLRIDDRGQKLSVDTAWVYLSKGAHELVVRYASDQVVRSLKVEIAFGNEPLAPLSEGLFSGPCP